jgi:4-hydroxy-tetrahydrodipicolinate reductase
MSKIRIGVVGCAGRMGQALIRQILTTEGCVLSGGTERVGADSVGKSILNAATLEPTGLVVGDDAKALIDISDVVIDFTAPMATLHHAHLAAAAGVAHIVGTTGLGDDHQKALDKAAEQTVIVQSANMSLGVNLLLGLSRQVASLLDEDFDIEVLEMHHRHKVDAPSGTALALGAAVAEGRGVDLAAVSDRVRDGLTGPRERGHIGFATLRGGNVVGDHTVIFAADDERIELTHKAGDRAIFARGAVKAALWAHGKKPGRYSMADVLGFSVND